LRLPPSCFLTRRSASGLRILPDADFLIHPNIRGLGKLRQWILDNIAEEVVFMADDDVYEFACMVGSQARNITDPEAIMSVIEQTAWVAKKLGTVVFSYSHTIDTRHFKSNHPFSFTGYANGFQMGIIGRTIRFDAALDTKQDIDYSLQALLRYRFIWRDMRFAFRNSQWFQRPGGNSTVRTQETVDRDIRRLKMKWGPAVEIDHKDRKGRGIHQNVHIRVQR
jgi:hypothetical protein